MASHGKRRMSLDHPPTSPTSATSHRSPLRSKKPKLSSPPDHPTLQTHTASTFNYLALPAEIRAVILALVLEHIALQVITLGDNDPHFTSPLLPLLLINKNVNSEVRRIIAKEFSLATQRGCLTIRVIFFRSASDRLASEESDVRWGMRQERHWPVLVKREIRRLTRSTLSPKVVVPLEFRGGVQVSLWEPLSRHD